MDPKLEDVFKLSGVPTVTFVPPIEYERLLVSLRTRGRGLVVEGPSGIGKTTAVRTALRELRSKAQVPDNLTELSARRVGDLDFIARLEEFLPFGTVIIDDFHRLPAASRSRLSDLLKTLADEESEENKLVLIGINRSGESLVRLAPDLNNRIDTIRFEANPSDRVRELLLKGSDALNISFLNIEDMAECAFGSFYVAQMLGFHTCRMSGITERQEEPTLARKPLVEVIGELFGELDRVFYPPTRDFCRGQRPRPRGRAPYMWLLYWLSQEENWALSVPHKLAQHTEHKGSVGQIADKGYVKAIVENNEDIARVLSWDEDGQLLVVQDPQYMFYLKNILWSKFPRRIGYQAVSFPPSGGKKYDIALSFAGSDREIAEALFEELSSLGFSVFYDANESHRILAENVEEYLAPIYESESSYVVVLLGPDYPKRIWTKFESDHFRARFGEGAVIPIWFDDAPTQMFDESRRFGGLEFHRGDDLASQVKKFTEAIARKLEEVALLAPEDADSQAEIAEGPTSS
ncbi:MAG TPA: TIR domain-containing protein [Bellilinea sp.]|nr:TIR domain-containing protein [Bellilinea sp.]